MLARTRITTLPLAARYEGALRGLASGRRSLAIGGAAGCPTHHLGRHDGPSGSSSSSKSAVSAKPAHFYTAIQRKSSLGRRRDGLGRTSAAGTAAAVGRRSASTAHARRPHPSAPEEDLEEEPIPLPEPAPQYDTPRKLHQLLDSYVIAQTKAKKVLSTAVYSHYIRTRHNLTLAALEEQESRDAALRAQMEARVQQEHVAGDGPAGKSLASKGSKGGSRKVVEPVEPAEKVRMSKSNVLLIGPTGSGKTLLVQTLSQALAVPFATINATTLTQAGYIGDDVEVCIARLLQAAGFDTELAGVGIVYLDEVDKLAKSDSGSSGEGRTKDVGGLGVQQALLRLLEGNVVSVTMKGGPDQDAMSQHPMHPHGPVDLSTSPGRRRKTSPFPSMAGSGFGPTGVQVAGSKHEQTYHVNTSNILFIMSGAFVDLEKTILARTRQTGIGFGATLPKAKRRNELAVDVPASGSSLEPGRATEAKAVLDDLDTEDLVSYGFIPEFVGRLPVIASLRALTQADLMRILCEPRNSLVKQFTQLLAESGSELKITTPALKEIAKEAVRKGTGARALTSRMESLLQDALYDVPGSSIRHVLVTRNVVLGREPAFYFSRGERSEFYAAALEDEEQALGLGKAGTGMAVEGSRKAGAGGGSIP